MNPPTIRLELNGMRQSIVHALTQYNSELETQVNEEIEKAIESFDLHSYIQDEVWRTLREVVSSSLQSQIKWQLGNKITTEVERILAEQLNSK